MRILIINTDYPSFLRQLYGQNNGLGTETYARQLELRNSSFFGVFDAYSRGFHAAGLEAKEVHANNGLMQRQWALEAGSAQPQSSKTAGTLQNLLERALRRVIRTPFSTQHVLRSPFDISPWRLTDILIAQVKSYRPDVILNQSVSEIGSDILETVRPYTTLIVGQIASPLPENEDYRSYDLMISSLPNFVAYFRGRGVDARLNRLGFDRRVLDAVGTPSRDVDVSFVGSVSPNHPDRAALIEYLSEKTPLEIWGNGLDQFPTASPVHRRYKGEAWGVDMFRALARSKITVNNHIDIAGNHANNMRLYEATGMGALLITDRKSDIADIFEPGKEIVCYDSAEECAELIDYYSRNAEKRQEIAAAGQRRTLASHTYTQRAAELGEHFAAALAEGRGNAA